MYFSCSFYPDIALPSVAIPESLALFVAVKCLNQDTSGIDNLSWKIC